VKQPAHPSTICSQANCFEHWRGKADTAHYLHIAAFFPHFLDVSGAGNPQRDTHQLILQYIKWKLGSGKGTQTLNANLIRLLFKKTQDPVGFRISYSVFPSGGTDTQAGCNPKNPGAEPNPAIEPNFSTQSACLSVRPRPILPEALPSYHSFKTVWLGVGSR
jgi:hypothetical protein